MTKKIVETYLNFFKNPVRDEQSLAPILSQDFHFISALGEFQTAELFLKDLKRNALGIKEIQIHHIIAEGFKDGRITKIISTYDTSTVHPAISRI